MQTRSKQSHAADAVQPQGKKLWLHKRRSSAELLNKSRRHLEC